MTVLGPDRLGILASLSETIYAHGGSWLESRLTRYAGQFAGILRFDCPDEKQEKLLQVLNALEDLKVQIVKESNVPHRIVKPLNFEVHGHHRPGIVRSIASVIARIGGNIEELSTERVAAPQPGHFLFRTIGRVAVMQDFDGEKLERLLQGLGSDLTITVEEASIATAA
ncbi:MAG: hypothetical protein OSB65_00190 [Roseibacillus sp.]|nr:hypothetical protein [Roseibacillus sp.]